MRRFGRRLSKAAAALIALSIGGVLAAVSLAEPVPVKAIRNILFDAYLRASPRAFNPEMPVRIVDIDDESLARFGQWPWPRTTVARLVDAIGERDAAAIGLDIVFAEPDRTSPEAVLPLLPPSPERDALEKRILGENYSNDRVLADAFGKWPLVAGIVLNGAKTPPPIKAGFATAGDSPLLFVPKFDGALAPIDILRSGVKGFGALNWVPEYDQVIRRVPTILAVGEQLVPSLAIETLRVAQEASTIVIKSSNASGENAFGNQTGLVSVKVGAVVIPTDGDGSVRLRYAGTRLERRIPAWKLLAGEIDKSEIEGRIVFVGSSASALADMRASPLDPAIPGVEVHAEVVEHALAASRLARPEWVPGAEAIAIVLSALVASLVGYRFAPLPSASVGVASIGLAGLAGWRAFVDAHLLLDTVMPSVAGLLAFSATSIARWRASDSEKKAVRHAFGHYLSPAMVERLTQAPENLILGGEQREMTLLFSDVRGFTSLSETFKGNPPGLTQLMNRLLTPLTNAIIERSGTVDKYMGDAIMAFWNAPLDVEEHAALACETALAMRRSLDTLNREMRAEAVGAGRRYAEIDIGIGLNTGECIVGNMGSDIRFDYSVLGDPVNLASRLEGQTKTYGVNVLIGEATEALVRGRFALIELDLVQVKGKAEPQRIFALLGDATMLAQPSFTNLRDSVANMLAAYRDRRWDDAERLASGLLRLMVEYPVQGYVEMMRQRIERFRRNPPPDGWDGVFVAETK